MSKEITEFQNNEDKTYNIRNFDFLNDILILCKMVDFKQYKSRDDNNAILYY